VVDSLRYRNSGGETSVKIVKIRIYFHTYLFLHRSICHAGPVALIYRKAKDKMVPRGARNRWATGGNASISALASRLGFYVAAQFSQIMV
jgi:hypothetical protein